MQAVIAILLIAVVASLGRAMSTMSSGGGDPRRTVQALTVRISLSVALFVFLLIGSHFGWIQPHGVH
jgi:hypothetical protein